MRVVWKCGIGICVIALSAALGVDATLARAAAAKQAARGAAPTKSADQGLTDPVLAGALDTHAHMGPDSVEPSPRGFDVIDYAKLAKARGMRGFVIKQHFDETAGLANIARKEVPGVEVFGGIVLNRPVGGISAESVQHMAKVQGGWGRIVWMPTCGNGSMVRFCPPVPVVRNGEVLPEVKEVLGVIAKTRTVDSNGELVLATGHLPAQEALPVLHEAQAQGVKHMVVTHPVGSWTVAQMKEAISTGAFLEITISTYIREHNNAGNATPGKALVDAMKELGVEHFIISSDLGQTEMPSHPDGLAMGAKWLRSQGFTNQDLDRMLKENPARLMGLPLQ